MKPPAGITLYDGELATFWFDNVGILCAVAKETPRTIDKQKSNFELIRKISENKTICLLSDATASGPMDRETRDYTAKTLPTICKAMAVFSASSQGSYTASLFIALENQPIPIRMFEREEQAREWLLHYL